MALPDGKAVYLPISHEAPRGNQIGVQIPPDVRSLAGLDQRPQWVIVSEFNFDVHGARLRSIQGKNGASRYGTLPPSFFADVKAAFLKCREDRNQSQVLRHPKSAA